MTPTIWALLLQRLINMNKLEDYVKGSSFRIDLSKRMIIALLDKSGDGKADDRLNMHPYMALERRGLLCWDVEGCSITEAGKLVAKLLVLANFNENPINKVKSDG